MPIRSGSSGAALATRPVGVAVRLSVDEMWWHGWPFGYERQETNSGRSRAACRCARTSSSGIGQVGRARGAASVGGVLAQLRQRERHRGDIGRVERQQSLRGRRRTRHGGVHQRQRGLLGCQSGGAAHRPGDHRQVRRRGPADAQSPAGHTRRASRSSPRPCARDACRAAGDGVRASVSRSASATSSACRRAPRRRSMPSPVPGCGSGAAGMPPAWPDPPPARW